MRPSVLRDLLAAVASKPAFHALRTRQRLGYAVSDPEGPDRVTAPAAPGF